MSLFETPEKRLVEILLGWVPFWALVVLLAIALVWG
jgi:hypothetical protein